MSNSQYCPYAIVDHKTFEQFKKTANMGDAKSIYNVGSCYKNGIGVGKNKLEAFKYYKKATDLDILIVHMMLKLLYKWNWSGKS